MLIARFRLSIVFIFILLLFISPNYSFRAYSQENNEITKTYKRKINDKRIEITVKAKPINSSNGKKSLEIVVNKDFKDAICIAIFENRIYKIRQINPNLKYVYICKGKKCNIPGFFGEMEISVENSKDFILMAIYDTDVGDKGATCSTDINEIRSKSFFPYLLFYPRIKN